MARRPLAVAAAALALLAGPALAQNGSGDAAGGFGNPEEGFGDGGFGESQFPENGGSEPAGQGQTSPLPAWVSLGGELRVQGAAAYDPDLAARWRGVNRSRLRGDGEVEISLPRGWRAFASATAWYDPVYALRGKDSYTQAVRDSYARELQLREAYLAGSAGPVDATLGRQKIVWGRADTLTVTDVLTPVDRRDAGALDLGDIRRPVTAARLDGYFGAWQVTAAAIVEPRGDKFAPYGDPLYPGRRELPDVEAPEPSLANTQPALAVTGTFPGWDLSAYWARPFGHQADLTGTPRKLDRAYHRRELWGAAGSFQAGDWVARAEAARIDGFRYLATGDQRFRRLDALLGLEYGGLAQTTLIAELAVRHYPGYESKLDTTPEYVRETRYPWVLRGNRSFLREKLTLTTALRGFAVREGDGGLARFQADYELGGSWTATGKWLVYWPGKAGPLKSAGNADRVYAELRYAF